LPAQASISKSRLHSAVPSERVVEPIFICPVPASQPEIGEPTRRRCLQSTLAFHPAGTHSPGLAMLPLDLASTDTETLLLDQARRPARTRHRIGDSALHLGV
jgi:hypothetical protein